MRGSVVVSSPQAHPSGHRVLVCGAGAGGSAVAVDLALHGDDVVLTDIMLGSVPDGDQLAFEGVLGTGSVEVRSSELTFEKAVAGSSLIVVATRAVAMEEIVQRVAPFVSPDSTVVAACGGLVGLALARAIGGSGEIGPLVTEISCFPYSSRLTPSGGLRIRAIRRVRAASVPASRRGELAGCLPSNWYGGTADNVLHAALMNPNYVLHPAAMVINLASRDREEEVAHEGMTAGARRIADSLDRERVRILDALGLPVSTLSEIMSELGESGKQLPSRKKPDTELMLDRFLLEDCGHGLSLLAILAVAADLDVPTITALRHTFRAVYPDATTEVPLGSLGWHPPTLERIQASLITEEYVNARN